MSEYPKCGYHASQDMVVFESAEHRALFGDDWYDTPTALAESLRIKTPAGRPDRFSQEEPKPEKKKWRFLQRLLSRS